MNRKEILHQIKLEMKIWIDKIEIEHSSEIQETLAPYFEMISLMSKLPETPFPHKEKEIDSTDENIQTNLGDRVSHEEVQTIDNLNEGIQKDLSELHRKENSEIKVEEDVREADVKGQTSETKRTPFQEQQGESNHSETEETTLDVYTFERKLRGGTLPEINAFIPEGVVRKLSLENGDKIKARKMEDLADENRNRYHYTLISKGEGKESPDRKQLDYCIVEKEAGSLVVKESRLSGEEIRYNGVSYPTLLNEKDIIHFSIREGDIIDIAYKKENPAENRVLWKHEEIEPPKIKQVELHKKKRAYDSPREMVEYVSESLKGMTILIVGNEGSRTSYKEQIEKRGGEFMWIDAKEKSEKFSPLIKKATFVVFLLGLSGHTGMKKIKQLCKEQKIPFEATFHQGITSITRLVEDLAEKNKKESVSALS